VIGQAKGILMSRDGIDADAAFEVLREASQRLNVKVREVADQVIGSFLGAS
jgi:AmiR/NasT family two-component response regulator